MNQNVVVSQTTLSVDGWRGFVYSAFKQGPKKQT